MTPAVLPHHFKQFPQQVQPEVAQGKRYPEHKEYARGPMPAHRSRVAKHRSMPHDPPRRAT